MSLMVRVALVPILDLLLHARRRRTWPQSRRLTLGRGAVHGIRRPSAPLRLSVSSGVVWVTTSPSGGDVIVRAGERVMLRSAGPIVIEACGGEAAVCLSTADGPAARDILTP